MLSFIIVTQVDDLWPIVQVGRASDLEDFLQLIGFVFASEQRSLVSLISRLEVQKSYVDHLSHDAANRPHVNSIVVGLVS